MRQWASHRMYRWLAPMVVFGILVAALPHAAPVVARGGQAATLANDPWPYFGRDRDNTRFSPLTQADLSNIKKLGVAWTSRLRQFQVLSESFPQADGNT